MPCILDYRQHGVRTDHPREVSGVLGWRRGVEFTDDVEGAGRRHAEGYAFTIGAIGSAGTNFYNNAFER